MMCRSLSCWFRFFLFAVGGVASLTVFAQDRAAWMRQARWGVMNHYLADWIARADGEPMTAEKWNDLVDHFDVDALAGQVASVGAGYYLISIGQNSGYYLSPNATYDKIVGFTPSKCSRRDLVADLYAALQKRGIRLMVYLPSNAPNRDETAKTALQFQLGPYRNREFQLKWEAVIREWSLRWGKKVSGWWFDGCYWPNAMYRSAEPPNFESFAAAARAGNPDAVVAFNPGVVYRTISMTPCEDYIGGETTLPERWDPKRNFDGKIDGAQIHVLSFLGQRWGMGSPRFSTEQVVAWSKKIAATGGVVTWDTPVQRNGTMAPEFIQQLTAIGQALKQN